MDGANVGFLEMRDGILQILDLLVGEQRFRQDGGLDFRFRRARTI